MNRRYALSVICFACACSLAFTALVPPGARAAWPDGVVKVAVPTSRVGNGDIYGSATMVAQRTYPSWAGVQHVVIASGEADALSDAVVASSLCWAYDAPLLLVSKKTLPTVTRDSARGDRLGEPHGDGARRGVLGQHLGWCSDQDPSSGGNGDSRAAVAERKPLLPGRVGRT